MAIQTIAEEQPEVLKTLSERLALVLAHLARTSQGRVVTEAWADDLLRRLQGEFVGRMMADMEPWEEDEDLRHAVAEFLTRHLLVDRQRDFVHRVVAHRRGAESTAVRRRPYVRRSFQALLALVVVGNLWPAAALSSPLRGLDTWVVRVAGETEPASGALRVVEDRIYRRGLYLVVDAIVENTVAVRMDNLEVSVEFYNFFGELLGFEHTPVQPAVLGPRQKAALRVVTSFDTEIRKIRYRFTWQRGSEQFQQEIPPRAEGRDYWIRW